MGRDSLQNAVHLWSEKLFPGISGLENGFMTHQAAFGNLSQVRQVLSSRDDSTLC